MAPPLILTLGLHDDDQARFEALRQRHFPPSQNRVPAHLTLFHHLPGDAAEDTAAMIAMAARLQAPFTMQVDGVRSLGRGVAYTVSPGPLAAVRAGLARHWHDVLTAQDRQGWRPHVTIQNKAAPTEARGLLAAMQAGFSPFSVRAEGLLLWRYLGGPWDLLSRCPFRGQGVEPAGG